MTLRKGRNIVEAVSSGVIQRQGDTGWLIYRTIHLSHISVRWFNHDCTVMWPVDLRRLYRRWWKVFGASTGALWVRHLQQIPPTMSITIPITRVRGTSASKPPRVKQVAGELTYSTTMFSIPFMGALEHLMLLLLLQKSAFRRLMTIGTDGSAKCYLGR